MISYTHALPADMAQEMLTRAEAERVSAAEIVRRALRAYLQPDAAPLPSTPTNGEAVHA